MSCASGPKPNNTKPQIKIKQLLLLEKLQLKEIRKELTSIGLPSISDSEELIEHEAMMLVYSEHHEQAKWVIHKISVNIIEGRVGRTNNFREDTLIKTGTAEEKDYFLKRIKDNPILIGKENITLNS